MGDGGADVVCASDADADYYDDDADADADYHDDDAAAADDPAAGLCVGVPAGLPPQSDEAPMLLRHISLWAGLYNTRNHSFGLGIFTRARKYDFLKSI